MTVARQAAPGTTDAEHRLRLRADDERRVLDENDRLRARVAELEETVRVLRVQLPLMPYALDPDPAGPDPRWAATIPEQRDPAHDAAPAANAAPRRPPGR